MCVLYIPLQIADLLLVLLSKYDNYQSRILNKILVLNNPERYETALKGQTKTKPTYAAMSELNRLIWV